MHRNMVIIGYDLKLSSAMGFVLLLYLISPRCDVIIMHRYHLLYRNSSKWFYRVF